MYFYRASMGSFTHSSLIFVAISLCISGIFRVEGNSQLRLREDDNTTDRCNDLLNEFALQSSKFGLCAVTHARPIKICQKCVYQYQNVTHIYKTILQSNNTKGQKCQNVLLNADRLGILQQIYFYTNDLWTRGHCDSCYVLNKTSGDHQLSNNTETFIGYHSVVMACIQNHTQQTIQNGTVCPDCEKDYCALNTLYNDLKDIWDDAVCMDIVDAMNKTRTLWSDELKCIKRTRTVDVPLFVTLSLVSLIPFLFYLGAKKYSSQTRNQLQAQKRFAEHVTSEEENNKPSTSTR